MLAGCVDYPDTQELVAVYDAFLQAVLRNIQQQGHGGGTWTTYAYLCHPEVEKVFMSIYESLPKQFGSIAVFVLVISPLLRLTVCFRLFAGIGR